MDLAARTVKLPPSATAAEHARVTLHLAPVGAGFDIDSDVQLHSLVSSLLSTLQAVHEAGFVHRDIREDNVVKYFERWVLIDWELAGRADMKVWWRGKSLPDAVLAGELYTSQHDPVAGGQADQGLWWHGQPGRCQLRHPACGGPLCLCGLLPCKTSGL